MSAALTTATKQLDLNGFLDLEVLTLTQPAGTHTFSAHIEYEIGGAKKEARLHG